MLVQAEVGAPVMVIIAITIVVRPRVRHRNRILVNFHHYQYRAIGIVDHRGTAYRIWFYNFLKSIMKVSRYLKSLRSYETLKDKIYKNCVNYYRYSTNRHEKQDHHADTDSTVLPQLQNGSVKSAEAASFESLSYRSREYRNYGRDGSNRKYRGQASRRDSNHYYHSRDFKDRNSKDHSRDTNDTGEGSKDADHSRRQ